MPPKSQDTTRRYLAHSYQYPVPGYPYNCTMNIDWNPTCTTQTLIEFMSHFFHAFLVGIYTKKKIHLYPVMRYAFGTKIIYYNPPRRGCDSPSRALNARLFGRRRG